MRIFFANLLWFLSTLPDTLRFLLALRNPAKAQAAVARRRKTTRESDILLYEPTSGSTGGTKWIPYTAQLRSEFMRAVNPWMASLYLRHPGLLLGTHYWSISPYTEARRPPDGKRYGFAEDREYLGPIRCLLTRALFPVPASVAEIRDPDQHTRQTLTALLASRRLGLISIWHPSALLRLLEFATLHAEEVATGEQVQRLKERQYDELWPHLRVISCWDAAFARADAERLRHLFPKVEVEGKGLLATEGVVTFPWFGRRVAAVTSHTLIFERVDAATGEPIAGTGIGPECLKVGERYGVALTTGNGFSDYRLGDVVACVGFVGRIPQLEFLYRCGGTVDLHGEKLHPAFVAESLDALSAAYGKYRFAVLHPRYDRLGYRLLWEAETGNATPDPEAADAELKRNFHYAHARALGQLSQVEIVPVKKALQVWCGIMGLPESSAKIPALYRPVSDAIWRTLDERMGR